MWVDLLMKIFLKRKNKNIVVEKEITDILTLKITDLIIYTSETEEDLSKRLRKISKLEKR